MKPETNDLLKRAACIAGYDRAGEPWHYDSAGALVPKLTDTVREQDTEIVELRRHVLRLGVEVDRLRGLLRANEAVLEDVVGLTDRARVLREGISEAIGARSMHERDTLPPAPLVLEAPEASSKLEANGWRPVQDAPPDALYCMYCGGPKQAHRIDCPTLSPSFAEAKGVTP